jgi:1-aminocyclopropane-1-carboxylate deaminase
VLVYSEPPIQRIQSEILEKANVTLLVKREDLNHPFASGNKWWKLKFNLEEAQRKGHTTLLTFGGAYSNHIYATAAAARDSGFDSIGIIRGELTFPLNPTLSFAQTQGMQLHFVTREEYRKKTDPEFIEKLKTRFGDFYLIPEGGTNRHAIEGCSEWARKLSEVPFDVVGVPVGTGGTMAGLILGLPGKKVVGYSALRNGGFLNEEVSAWLREYSGREFSNWRIDTHYEFGGYAKSNGELMDFIALFERDHGIPLDPVYTGKMMFGVFDTIKRGGIEPGTTVLALHTGGLQGRSTQTGATT